MIELPTSFTHKPPKGYSYEVTQFKRNLIAIWIVNHQNFFYTTKTPKSIWGFFNTKSQTYHAPINHKTVGKKVDISDTRCYTSMQIKLNPLESLLYDVSS